MILYRSRDRLSGSKNACRADEAGRIHEKKQNAGGSEAFSLRRKDVFHPSIRSRRKRSRKAAEILSAARAWRQAA